MSLMTSSLHHQTPEIPGIGGVIKQRPEDFVVQEEPLHQPRGQGDHLILFIEKRQVTTSNAIRRLAKIFRVKRSDVGYAGLKDKQAITRQHFSVYLPQRSSEQTCLSRIQHTPLVLLWADRHDAKLRRGDLAGNRFVIRIREVAPSTVIAAKQVLDQLTVTGVPNFVGEQRFGYRQNNHLLGKYLLLEQWQAFLDHMLGQPRGDDGPSIRARREAYMRGDFKAALDAWPKQFRHDRQALDALRQGRPACEAVLGVDQQQLDFCLSGLQSAMFNQVLDQRLGEGSLAKLIDGDLAWEHASRAVFPVDQCVADNENAAGTRVARMQLSPSGPMWGVDMPKPAGKPLECEVKSLHDQGLVEDDLVGHTHARTKGSRRPLLAELRDCDLSAGIDEQGPHICVSFFLPRGSYATVVLREMMKPRPPTDRCVAEEAETAS